MQGLSCQFYADNSDLAELVQGFSNLGLFKYVQSRSALNRSIEVYTNPTLMLPLAMASPANPTRYHSFLVMECDQPVALRERKLVDGSGTRVFADQVNNWNSIVIAFGGEAGDNTLVMSDICTVGDTEESRQLHKKFKALVWSKTVRVGPRGTPSRLMSGAIAKAKAGWRLTPDKGFVRALDAKISPDEISAF